MGLRERLGWLWERSQELPEHWDAARQDRVERSRRALSPRADLRLLPAAACAWAAALLLTAPSGQGVGSWGSGRLSALAHALPAAAWQVAAAVLVGLLAAVALSLRGGRRGAHGKPLSLVPGLLLCLAAVVGVGAQAALQHRDAVVGAERFRDGPARVLAQVTDRPAVWASSGGPWSRPEGEGGEGAVVPVRLEDGRQAAVVAPEEWAHLRSGDRIEVAVLEGEASGRGLTLIGGSGPAAVLEGERSPTERARAAFSQLARQRGPDAAGLLPGMTFGDRQHLDPGLEQAMVDTGLSHLTAVSGSNCALVMALAGQLALLCGLRRRLCLLTGLVALALFVVLVGPDPSVLRAAVMGAIGAAGLLLGRGGLSLSALCAAVLILLALDPGMARELGFALSVSATAGIIISGRPLIRLLERIMPTPAAAVLAVPSAAQLWCSPVLTLISPTESLYAVPANVIASPAVPLVTVLGLAALILVGAGPGPLTALAGWVLVPASWLTGLIAAVARRFAAAPGALLPWPEPPVGPVVMLAICFVLVVAVQVLDRRLRRRRAHELVSGPAPAPIREAAWRRQRGREHAVRLSLVGAALLLLAAAGVVWRWPSAQAQDWQLLACDVGQGDAVLLRGVSAQGESTVLLDAGPDPSAVRTCLRRAGVQRLDLLVLTHDHADHAAGAAGLGDHVEIERLWYSSGTGRAPAELARLGGDPARPLIPTRPQPGTQLRLPGLALTVLGPQPRERAAVDAAGENDASLAVRAELDGPHGTLSVLAAGDLEETGARSLIRQAGPLLRADVLKVSHHGARNGGTELIDAAAPTLAVISVGADNDYGHPHPSTLEHLASRGVPVARTDEHGALAVGLDAQGRPAAVRAG